MTKKEAVMTYANGAQQGLVRYSTARGEIAITLQQVKELFCPKATDAEALLFLRVCQYQQLNPFLREVHLVKYAADQPASIVVGKDTYTQRAEAHPQFDGVRAGVIVQRGEQVVEVEGTLVLPGDTLLGGWAEVYRKDRRQPFKHTVALAEYSRNQSTWRTMPATMVRKVALVQALREAFPASFVGLYDAAELGAVPDAVEVQGRVVEGGETAPVVDQETGEVQGTGAPDLSKEEFAAECKALGLLNAKAVHEVLGMTLTEWFRLGGNYRDALTTIRARVQAPQHQDAAP